ncbi:MAG: GNAT family N-acetyltransferase [Erysipelotrichaceae bacterium]|nr:GNAT family N-acetyltransferase [Erysipelotrichaceae bacterium]
MNRCPGKTFLLIRGNDNRIVGTVNVRWDLNEAMLRFGGHIGYGIRPSERRKGYNKINLYLALKEAKKIGLDRVMIDCAVSNIASDKTIQDLGGILERCEIDPVDGELTNVYWINVEESLTRFKAEYEPYITVFATTIQELLLKDLQPSQFYISEKKLHDIEAWLDPKDLSGFEPIPVKILDGIPVMTDGHTRAVAALRSGLTTVPLAADEDDLDWDMYRACVKACKESNIFSPADLLQRIIPELEYQEKWNKWCDNLQAEIRRNRITVRPYTEQELPDVLDFERRLREEEDFWGWEIDEQYIKSVKSSFQDPGFDNAISFLVYVDGLVAGRIDAVLLPSHFDGSVKAYLDWICVIKSYRHMGIAQALLAELKQYLKEKGVTTLIALTASNYEAQRFYRSITYSEIKDTGIWIDIK